MSDPIKMLMLVYFAVINVIGILINISDKRRAKKNKWRIKEHTLWSVALLGGSIGSYAAMRLIHHKTKHKSFMIGFPILILIQIIIAAIVIYLTNT